MNVRSATLTMTGAPVSFAAAVPAPTGYVSGKSLQVKWVQAVTPPANADNVLVGGAEVTTLIGFPLPPGWSGQLFPVDGSDQTSYYELLGLMACGTTGDVVYLLFG